MGNTRASASAAANASPASSKKPSRHPAGEMPASARNYYALTWGIDQLAVKLAESGQLARFNYRVLDAAKAKALNDRASSPNLLDEKAHAVLQVPTMEKVGPLRQSMPPDAGKLLLPGSKIRWEVVGPIRVDGLIVQ